MEMTEEIEIAKVLYFMGYGTMHFLYRYQHVEGTSCVFLQGTSYTSLHGSICQKTGIFINTTVKTPNFMTAVYVSWSVSIICEVEGMWNS